MGFSTSSPRVIKVLSASRSSSRSASRDTVSSVQSTPKVIKFDVIWFTLFVSNFQFIVFNTFRVSTKWLNLLRKICAIFAQFFFCELLCYFCAWNAMSFALFFCAICAKPEIFFAKCFAWNEILVLRNFLAQNRKFYAKCNFLGTLSKIDILSLELNNWRFIPYIKKY